MIIDAYPREGVQFRTKPVYQYDYGQIVKIHLNSLPAVYKVEFSNSTRADAVSTVQSTDEVIIPAQFLTSGSPIYAWIVVVDESARTTEYTLVVPVIARARPTDAEPTPEEQTEIEQTLSALNGAVSDVQEIAEAIPGTINDALEAAKESGEFDGQDGVSPTVTVTEITGGHRITIIDKVHPNGQVVDVLDGTNGRGIVSVERTGTSGLTDTYTITYTSGDPTTFTVVNGKDGQDAISPEITVASITGGHRITITDANGTHTVDVLDGAKGDTGRGIVSVQKTGTAGLADTYTITYTDSTTSTFTVTNGQDGAPGVGIPSGGTDGQMVVKDGNTDYATKWANQPSVPVQDVQIDGASILSNGVANVPIASDSAPGVVKISNYNGTGIGASRSVFVVKSTDAEVKAGSQRYKPIVPESQHISAFYGLAKAAGDTTQSASSNPVGTYTDVAIDKILAMLSVIGLIAPHETGAASQPYAQGECFVYSGKLYRATAAIASAEAITPGTNCEQTTLMAEINR